MRHRAERCWPREPGGTFARVAERAASVRRTTIVDDPGSRSRRAGERASGCAWVDAGEIVVTSPLDGWYLEGGEHEKLGIALAGIVRRILA